MREDTSAVLPHPCVIVLVGLLYSEAGQPTMNSQLAQFFISAENPPFYMALIFDGLSSGSEHKLITNSYARHFAMGCTCVTPFNLHNSPVT